MHYKIFSNVSGLYQSFPEGSVLQNPLVLLEPQETWIRALGQEDPLE